MVSIIIPFYKNCSFLQSLLFSLVCQTKRPFLTLIVDDCSEEDVRKTIEPFKSLLPIKYLRTPKNLGPAGARQYGLDNLDEKIIDYVMFADSDDMVYPRAIEVLHREAKVNNADIVVSNIEVEEKCAQSHILPSNDNLTWLHGKIYKLEFLRKNNLQFWDGVRYKEDTTFNLKCRYLANKIIYLDETTYLWRNNEESIPRDKKRLIWFQEKASQDYILGQIHAMTFVVEKQKANMDIALSLVSIYQSFQKNQDKYEQLFSDTKQEMEELLGNKKFIELFYNKKFINNFINHIPNVIHTNKPIIPKETIIQWLDRYNNKEIKRLLEDNE